MPNSNISLKGYRVVTPGDVDGWPVHTHDHGEVFAFPNGTLLDLRHEKGPRPCYFRRIWDAVISF